ncbi:hypothetical protein GCM10012275_02360 [Longimycelium tulufanense]|uniref:Uncharacterized protein n=1 Tax=Longimycelium tulufanense TaxID=907463 RepID=A0A8J3FTI8_9PSEU|nr:hypothetical protein GCM10012275_02360 [Longimycelium tulufanense]
MSVERPPGGAVRRDSETRGGGIVDPRHPQHPRQAPDLRFHCGLPVGSRWVRHPHLLAGNPAMRVSAGVGSVGYLRVTRGVCAGHSPAAGVAGLAGANSGHLWIRSLLGNRNHGVYYVV